jgi:CRAL/TRIO, N-terminal domain
VFSLTEKQTTALKSAQQWMIDDNVEIGVLVNQALHPNLILLRYLRANKFDVEATIAHMKKNLVWRRDQLVNELNELQPEEILGCSIDKYQSFLPH